MVSGGSGGWSPSLPLVPLLFVSPAIGRRVPPCALELDLQRGIPQRHMGAHHSDDSVIEVLARKAGLFAHNGVANETAIMIDGTGK